MKPWQICHRWSRVSRGLSSSSREVKMRTIGCGQGGECKCQNALAVATAVAALGLL